MTPPGAGEGASTPIGSAIGGSRKLHAVESAQEAQPSPSLHAPERPPHNLPLELSSFVGRKEEIAEVKRLLGEVRLLTLTGAGGCGKTPLALAVASDMVSDHEDGVWLVELAPLSDPELVPQAVASALEVREQPARPLTQTLVEHLRPKKCSWC